MNMRMRRGLPLLVLLIGLSFGQTFVIPIHGEIDSALAIFVKQSLAQAERAGASGVVLVVDTPGGRVDAAIKISDAIISSPLPTLAVVRNAFSAGALISLSAQQIAMLPGSEIGAALPINVLPGTKPTAADRKVISALAGKFRAVAEAHGRPGKTAAAMVDPEINIKGLTQAGEPLTLSAKQAVELKIADFQAANLQGALQQAGYNANTKQLKPGSRVQLARFLTSIYVAPILLAIGILGLLIEIFTPGFGVFGAVGVASLALYFLGGYLAGLSGTLELLLFFAGILLILTEVFIIPGLGIAGAGGVLAILASVYFTFGARSLEVGSYTILLVAAGLLVFFRFFPYSRAGRILSLNSVIAEHAPPTQTLAPLIGVIGTALTDLRPAGIARLGERRVDVVTDGEYILKGETVRVIQVEGARVVVRREA